MPSNRARERGFSLLELIIVLMVMISLLAVAWPNLQRPLRRNSLNEAAQTIRNAIDDSRYQAITTGTPVFVQLRQGADMLQSGTFDDFMNADSDLAASAATSLQPPTTLLQSKIQQWSLPESVVISDMRWTLEAPAEEFGEELGEEHVEAPLVVAEVQSEAMFSSDSGASKRTWWLPLVGTGQGRDAAIVLLDTSINEEITVTFASATGALEIVR